MKAVQIDPAAVRILVTEIVRELGFVIHHCEESARDKTWHANTAQELSTACDAATNAKDEIFRLEGLLHKKAVQAEAVAQRAGKKIRTCRKCGCTHTTPCVDQRTGATCHWVEKDLCSMCAPKRKKGRR